MAERRKRQFNCKPCGRKHPAPVNANCEFQRARQDENPQPGPSNMGRTLRGTRRRTVGAAQTPKAKPSKRVLAEEDSPGSAHEQPGREDPLDRIMQRLDSLADEGRRARQNLADETRREHEKLRQAMRSMQVRQTADILSDEEEGTPRKRRRTDCWGECMYAGCVHGVRGERSDVRHSLRSLWYQSGHVLGECSTLKVS